jgi:hypothetical protein
MVIYGCSCCFVQGVQPSPASTLPTCTLCRICVLRDGCSNIDRVMLRSAHTKLKRSAKLIARLRKLGAPPSMMARMSTTIPVPMYRMTIAAACTKQPNYCERCAPTRHVKRTIQPHGASGIARSGMSMPRCMPRRGQFTTWSLAAEFECVSSQCCAAVLGPHTLRAAVRMIRIRIGPRALAERCAGQLYSQVEVGCAMHLTQKTPTAET